MSKIQTTKRLLISKIVGVKILEHKRYSDARGMMIEMFREDDLVKTRLAMATWSLTEPGQIRGPHEHKHQTDRFMFLGPGILTLHLWDNRPGIKFPVETHESFCFGINHPCTVIIPPGIVHGYKNNSQVPALALNFPDKLYAGWNKEHEVDEIRHELNPDSIFKIQ